MQKRMIILAVSAWVGLVGCSEDRTPPGDVRAAFSYLSLTPTVPTADTSDPSADLSTDKYEVRINKKALEKEFLLQGALIVQPVVAFGNGLKSRVVFFKRRADRLYMLESLEGNSVTHDLPQSLILTSFEIKSESDDWLGFDFNNGMARIFTAEDWRGRDFSGPLYDPTLLSVKVAESFLESVSFSKSNALVIRQIAQVEVPTPNGTNNVSVEAKYYLSPYRANAGFEPYKTTSMDQFGFFEIAPQLSLSGGNIVYASKHDLKKPILYALSANTPADYRDAVREGVLYWNQALGEGKIQTVDAPEGVVAPDADYNVIQWVPWDLAGFAYADAQMDPRTGEILHAQVYMTSVFAFASKSRTRALLRRLATSPEAFQVSDRGIEIGLKGFEKSRLCDRRLQEESWRSLLHLATLASVSDEQVFKASKDYVREVVAHEVGHTLGLRHNFAGSLAANYPLSKRNEMIRNYLEGRVSEGLITSSSVMEYQRFEESVITGDQILKKKILPYDERAIQALYLGKKIAPSATPAFCTDSQVRLNNLGCARQDIGASFLEAAAYDYQESLRLLPRQLIESYILAKGPGIGADPVPVENMVPNPMGAAAAVMKNRELFISAYLSNAEYFVVRRSFPLAMPFNLEEVRLAEQSFLESESAKLGGIEAAFPAPKLKVGEELFRQFVALLEDPNYASGVGADGQSFSFSEEERAIMKKNVKKFFQKFEEELILAELKLLPNTNFKLRDYSASDELADVYLSRALEVLFAQVDGEDLILEADAKSVADKKVRLVLPKFAYPQAARVLAAGLLKAERSTSIEWGTVQRSVLKARWAEMLKKALAGLPQSDFQLEGLPRQGRKWFLENQQVLSAM